MRRHDVAFAHDLCLGRLESKVRSENAKGVDLAGTGCTIYKAII